MNIPIGATQSLLFAMNLTVQDSDTFMVNTNGTITYPVEGTAIYMNFIEQDNNGKVAQAGGDGYAAIVKEANQTLTSSAADHFVEAFNYHALKIDNVTYPAETVMGYQIFDSVNLRS